MTTSVDKTSAVTAAAAITLAQQIIEQVSDENFSDMLQGSVVSSSMIAQMVATSAARHLSDTAKYVQEA